ncbi:MAG: hypothetical protein M3Q59_09885, partial [Actinomycetota bacterium]|nr:hypothetical protein [Actinomycetota bacterium]
MEKAITWRDWLWMGAFPILILVLGFGLARYGANTVIDGIFGCEPRTIERQNFSTGDQCTIGTEMRHA